MGCVRFGAGKGASWHPPVAMHLLRGEAIAWIYTLALLDAIYMLEDDLSAGKSHHALRKGDLISR